MGSTPPSTQVIKQDPPTVYKSVYPLQSYKQLGDVYRRGIAQSNQARQDLMDMAGTPAQLGAFQKGVISQAAATYAASLPQGDKYNLSGTGGRDPYAAAKQTAQQVASNAQTAYAQALENINKKPKPLDETLSPSWEQETIPEGMPKA